MQNNSENPKVGYTLLPKDIFNLKISSDAKLILIYLYGFITADEIRPTIDTIAENVGMSWDKVNRYLKELMKEGLILKQKGYNAANRYTIVWKTACDLIPKPKERVAKSTPIGSQNRDQSGSQNRDPINNKEINNIDKISLEREFLRKADRINLVKAIKRNTVVSKPHISGIGVSKEESKFISYEFAENLGISRKEAHEIVHFVKYKCTEKFEEYRVDDDMAFKGLIKWLMETIENDKKVQLQEVA